MVQICISFSYRISLQVPWQSNNLQEEGPDNFQISITYKVKEFYEMVKDIDRKAMKAKKFKC